MEQHESTTTEAKMENNVVKVATPPATSGSVNPILKHHSPAVTLVKSSSQTDKKSLKWDENAIEEHDKLRGTRMKVRIFSRLTDVPILSCSIASTKSV